MSQQAEAMERTDEVDETARQEAIRQIQRKRHFHVELLVGVVGMVLLVVVWATASTTTPAGGRARDSASHPVFMTFGTAGSSTRWAHGY